MLISISVSADSSPMSYQSKSAIIGGVVGSLGVLCLIVVFTTLLVKYRKRYEFYKTLCCFDQKVTINSPFED